MRREGRIAFCANVSHTIHLSYGSNKEAKRPTAIFASHPKSPLREAVLTGP